MSAEDPERAQRELEALLRRVEPDRPSAAARDEARRLFLAGLSPGRLGASQPVPAARRERGMPPSADQLLPGGQGEGEVDGFAAWLAAHSEESVAAETRRRARLVFLSAVSGVPTVVPPSRSFRALVLVAAAAAILLVTFLVPEPDRWRVRLDGGVALDEEDFAPGQEDRLGAELERSGWIETGRARARFALGRVLELELLPGSSFRFPALPELDGLAPLDFELARGEAYLRTLGPYPGNPILIRTQGADVALSGTTVGVLVDEAGTCVCVADGSVRITGARLAQGSEDVPALRSLRLFRDPAMGPKSEPFDTTGNGPEALHVQELLEFHRGL